MQTTNGDPMKFLTIIYFALFPFLHNTVYTAKLTSCESNNIVINSQGEDMIVSLFNLNIIHENGWNRTCTMLKEADEITFEIDPSSKIDEPIPVYLFADGKFIHEEIIRNQEGYSIIHNPEYKYEKQLEELSNISSTVADPSEENDEHQSRPYGFVYLFIFVLLWSLLFYHLIYKQKRSKKITNHRN